MIEYRAVAGELFIRLISIAMTRQLVRGGRRFCVYRDAAINDHGVNASLARVEIRRDCWTAAYSIIVIPRLKARVTQKQIFSLSLSL